MYSLHSQCLQTDSTRKKEKNTTVIQGHRYIKLFGVKERICKMASIQLAFKMSKTLISSLINGENGTFINGTLCSCPESNTLDLK